MFNQQGEERDKDGNVLVNSSGTSGKGKRNNNKNGPPPDISTVKCFRCHKLGHYSSSCTAPIAAPKDKNDKDEDKEGTNMLITAVESGEFDGYVFFQDCSTNLDNIGRSGKIPDNWVLLNTSTVD